MKPNEQILLSIGNAQDDVLTKKLMYQRITPHFWDDFIYDGSGVNDPIKTPGVIGEKRIYGELKRLEEAYGVKF